MTPPSFFDDLANADAVSRRRFLGRCAALGAGVCAAGMFGIPAFASEGATGLQEALYYRRLSRGRVQCLLCPNRCVVPKGDDGRCRARGNRGGRYYSLVHGRPCVLALDAVEKCPLYHFQVKGKAFSLATAGCNLSCRYCQNWSFALAGPEDVPKSYEMTPEAVVAKALEHKAGAIAYFYTEPTVYYEYMLDIAKLARRRGLKNVMVTAGYINPAPLKALLPHIDAVTLGLKGWNEAFYRDYVGGELRHVKETIRILAAAKDVWWEIVTLVVPALTDDMGELAAMAAWLRRTAGPERPLHFTRFRPAYQLKRLPKTPAATLTRAREVAMEQGLRYVYVGNLPGHTGANTLCPRCKETVVERLAFTVLHQEIQKGKCRFCGHEIKGVWL